MTNFSEQLIAARKAKAMTQDQLAQAVHISRSRVSRWETGSAMPDLAMLLKLSEVLEVDLLPHQEHAAQPAEPTEAAPEQPAEAPAEEASSAEEETAVKAVPFYRKRLLWGALAALAVAVVLLICLLPGGKSAAPVVFEEYTAEWYQQKDPVVEGQAYVTVTPAENPTKAIRMEDFKDGVGWFYVFRIEETNGVDFTITRIVHTVFAMRGPDNMVFEGEQLAEVGKNVTLRKGMPMPVEWGGGFPLQNISGVGLAVTGVDANGNELTFRGYVELSPEIAE